MKRTRGKKGRISGRVVDKESISQIERLIGNESIKRDMLIEHLHKIQDTYHYISNQHLKALAKIMNLSMAAVYETATFYHHFDVINEKEKPPPEITVRVCDSVTCEMFGAKKLINELKLATDSNKIRIQAVPCVGRCASAPIAVTGTYPIENAKTNDVLDALNKNILSDSIPENYIDYVTYKNNGGYKTLIDCIDGKYNSEDIIKLLEDSALRGLGGAGFPTGQKWRILSEKKLPKMIAINIDEGEPGTFKDRHYLESDPHRFIEGTLIAHWAINADEIYIYLRDEYAGCRILLEKELEKIKKDPPCKLPQIHLRRGAGAYICGEESAMIESIEGKAGMPRLRPPYVADVGLFGLPTLEQNMETVHWVRDIIEKGADWFSSNGRRERKGLRSFSISGRIKKPGVHVAPAGISINELIDEYCGGMLDGHEFYGYYPGGASGGILPASLGDEPLDFDTLQKHDCFIGSAAIIVLSNQDKVKGLALNSMRFFEHESCGQCTPCRVGTSKAIQLMEKEEWDKDLLEELSVAMCDASICGLGQAAPNPVRCTIRYFPEELKKWPPTQNKKTKQ